MTSFKIEEFAEKVREIFGRDPEIEKILSKIGSLPDEEKETLSEVLYLFPHPVTVWRDPEWVSIGAANFSLPRVSKETSDLMRKLLIKMIVKARLRGLGR